MADKSGCSFSIGCLTIIFVFLFFIWFFFMGGCTLIYKKTQDAIKETNVETSIKNSTP